MSDSISDLIIKIKNASIRGLETVSFPHSKLTLAISELLLKEGYIKSITKKGKKVNKTIEVALVYDEKKEPRVSGVSRVSKFSKRMYSGFKDLRPIRSGYGMTVLTTPKGIMSDKDAKTQKVGGEVLFKIW